MEAISQEMYEQVRAQVITEMRTERLERQREYERTRKASMCMFDELKVKYMPRLIAKAMSFYPNRTDHYGIAYGKFEHVTRMAISSIGERNAKTAYRNGKAEDAVRAAEEIFKQVLEE